jgi:uncharacterized phage-associated protein
MDGFILDKEKYKAAFLYISNRLGKVEGKKRAYKIFYYLDFDFYEAYEKPFTGDTYTKLPMGPAPLYMDSIIEELATEGKIEIKKAKLLPLYENDMIIYTPKVEEKYSFSREEKNMLDRIIDKYGKMTGKDLEKLSHAEAPFNSVDYYQVIPYEYSIYRDTQGLKE